MTIGERLKSAREAKKISLEEVCRVTRIQRKTLDAIEEDRIDDILDPAYARIFIKKYAAFLGVNGSAIMEEYQAARPSEPERPLAVQTEITRHQQQASAPSLWVPLGAGLVALVGIAFLVYLSIDLFQNLSSRPASDRPPARSASAEPKTPERPLLVPRSKPLKLTIQATADVWIQVKADGAVIFQNVLSKGSQESWTAKNDLELWTGNAGAMKLSLNGKPLEGIGRGVKKGVRVTHSGVES